MEKKMKNFWPWYDSLRSKASKSRPLNNVEEAITEKGT